MCTRGAATQHRCFPCCHRICVLKLNKILIFTQTNKNRKSPFNVSIWKYFFDLMIGILSGGGDFLRIIVITMFYRMTSNIFGNYHFE